MTPTYHWAHAARLGLLAGSPGNFTSNLKMRQLLVYEKHK